MAKVNVRSVICFCLPILLGTFSAVGEAAEPAAPAETPAASGAQTTLPPVRAKALSDWSYALAIDTASRGAPLVTMYNLRYNDVFGPSPKAPRMGSGG